MKTWKLRTSQRTLIALCLCACVRAAQALEATPSYQVFTLKPGERVSTQVVISNNNEGDLNVTPEVKDWFTTPANKKIKTADWLKVDTKPFVLKNNEQRIVKFSAQAPKKAVGEVMGMISFNTKPVDGSMLTFRLSLATYVTIAGTEKVDGEVAAISVTTSSDTVVRYLFANRGNVHLRPYGVIKIFDENDMQVLNAVYGPGVPTFPGTKREYMTRIRNYQLPFGHYRAEINFKDSDWNIEFPVEKKKFEYKSNGKLKGQ